MFENKTAKEPIRREKIDHFVAQDNEPYRGTGAYMLAMGAYRL